MKKPSLDGLKNIDWKSLALNYGDKAGVGICALCFLIFAYSGTMTMLSASDPTLTPEIITNGAKNLTSKVQQSQFGDQHAKEVNGDATALADINPDFSGDVERLKGTIDASNFAWEQWFFHFEDFGAILRGQPEIYTPDNLLAFSDKGSTWMYKRDADGQFVVATSTKKGRGRSSATAKKVNERRKARDNARQKNGLGGRNAPPVDRKRAGVGLARGRQKLNRSSGSRRYIELDEPKKEAESSEVSSETANKIAQGGDPTQGFQGVGGSNRRTSRNKQNYEEEVKGLRWAVVTALYPHGKQLREYYRTLHDKNEHPNYARVEVERRELQEDGSFSAWKLIDDKPIKAIESTIPYWEDEHDQLAPALFASLVMRLPKLATGEWLGFSVDRREALLAAKAAYGAIELSATEEQDGESLVATNEGQPKGQAMDPNASYSNAGAQGYRGGSAKNKMGSKTQGGYNKAGSQGYNGGSAKGGMGSGGMSGDMGGSMAGVDLNNQQETQQRVRDIRGRRSKKSGKGEVGVTITRAQQIQIRFVDYTVTGNQTYQYRMRVVVHNPNRLRRDVADEKFKAEEFLKGDFSEASPVVYVPSDFEYYVLNRTQRKGEAYIQVHRWLQDMGDWQMERFRTAPGDMIGQPKRQYEFVTFENEVDKRPLDFSTDEILVDVKGVNRKYSFEGYGSITAEIPAQILVMDPFGELSTRSEGQDAYDPTRVTREQDRADLLAIVKHAGRTKRGDEDNPDSPETGGPDDFQGYERNPVRRNNN